MDAEPASVSYERPVPASLLSRPGPWPDKRSMNSLKHRLLPAATTIAMIVVAVETFGAGLKWS